MKKLLSPTCDDKMPYQVATSMLTEPKAKMSNTFRKQCQKAREDVFRSAGPITNHPVTGAYCEPDHVARTAEEKIYRRMRKGTTPQLLKWLKRCKARRRSVQEKYLKTAGKEGRKWDYIRTVFEAAARRIDEMAGAIEDILGERFQHYEMNDGPERHVHPRHKRDYYKPNKKICLAA